ncbi:division/cell wall cluster transcriptional repressor MraZ [Syntrophorhabdus aromaticivorans]|uniref:Transcriptional regulator MraZ n=1 Tax=Syntrophorhabdus aromaticivorans TaxID=328301 RepID=A0A971M6F1_9BACT|nr:division/cell wall cluster transcriptional repressor MraZ [Syntrophorhabdus aromaticivorans]NLW36715.1 division/cell wall cluster transcriptional repressor MraZ [Syntrophorhabdus aromaticivorans]
MFAGRYEYAIDDKSRVSIPAKFREVLSTSYDMRLILTNLDGCIVGYPFQEWLLIQEKTSNPGAIKKEARAFLRYFYSGISECPIDRLGRILIPQALKSDAMIRKDVVIIGMGKKIEIWAQERWAELVKKATSDPDQVADIVSELGL